MTEPCISIRPIRKEDCEQVAKLHNKTIQVGLFSALGVPFVKLIYESMVSSEMAFCIVAADGGNIVGFISGITSFNKFYREFLKRNFAIAALLLLPKIIRPNIVRKVFNVLAYPTKIVDLPDAELMSLAVDEKYRAKGLAIILIGRVKKIFAERGIPRFKAMVDSKLTSVCRLYEALGAKFCSDLAVYNNKEKWKVYVWENNLHNIK